MALQVWISGKQGRLPFEHGAGPLEFGREPRPGLARRVVDDPYLSKDQLRVEELAGARLQVENLSTKVPARAADGKQISPGTTVVLPLPVRLTVGMTQLDFSKLPEPVEPEVELHTIARPDFSPGAPMLTVRASIDAPTSTGPERLALWFETLLSVQRAAACSAEFYQEIARAMVDLIGLDQGLFLELQGDSWTALAGYPLNDATATFSQTVLDRVRKERRTYYQGIEPGGEVRSLVGVKTVVASPVFGAASDEVVAAVYGVRNRPVTLTGNGFSPLHAQLVQVLAAAATAGIARLDSEAEAARRHVQFEQFFSRELAGELDRDPELLAGQDREVSVLVADVRGFSRISERLGPRETCRLMGDVLDRLTARILAEGGVVVDYVGDGVMAMWNAPVPQPDHALRSCRAALAMLGELPELSAQWSDRAGVPIGLGIGVNTGEALVGNVGSRHRLKYGPIGNTVNLASRVEGATKLLGVPVLITGRTHALLAGALATRRLGRVRVVGIDTPVNLHELHTTEPTPEWLARRDAYESALDLFEKHRLSEACRVLFPLIENPSGGHDQPSLTLAARAIDGLRGSGQGFDPVIALESK